MTEQTHFARRVRRVLNDYLDHIQNRRLAKTLTWIRPSMNPLDTVASSRKQTYEAIESMLNVCAFDDAKVIDAKILDVFCKVFGDLSYSAPSEGILASARDVVKGKPKLPALMEAVFTEIAGGQCPIDIQKDSDVRKKLFFAVLKALLKNDFHKVMTGQYMHKIIEKAPEVEISFPIPIPGLRLSDKIPLIGGAKMHPHVGMRVANDEPIRERMLKALSKGTRFHFYQHIEFKKIDGILDHFIQQITLRPALYPVLYGMFNDTAQYDFRALCYVAYHCYGSMLAAFNGHIVEMGKRDASDIYLSTFAETIRQHYPEPVLEENVVDVPAGAGADPEPAIAMHQGLPEPVLEESSANALDPGSGDDPQAATDMRQRLPESVLERNAAGVPGEGESTELQADNALTGVQAATVNSPEQLTRHVNERSVASNPCSLFKVVLTGSVLAASAAVYLSYGQT